MRDFLTDMTCVITSRRRTKRKNRLFLGWHWKFENIWLNSYSSNALYFWPFVRWFFCHFCKKYKRVVNFPRVRPHLLKIRLKQFLVDPFKLVKFHRNRCPIVDTLWNVVIWNKQEKSRVKTPLVTFCELHLTFNLCCSFK